MSRVIYLRLFLFLVGKFSFYFMFLGLQVGGKLVHNLPLQGSLGRGRYFKTFFPFRFFSINFWINSILATK